MTPTVPLIDLLYQAINSAHGIIVRTSDPERLRAKLYIERKKDPSLKCLSFSISRTHPDQELIIVKNES